MSRSSTMPRSRWSASSFWPGFFKTWTMGAGPCDLLRQPAELDGRRPWMAAGARPALDGRAAASTCSRTVRATPDWRARGPCPGRRATRVQLLRALACLRGLRRATRSPAVAALAREQQAARPRRAAAAVEPPRLVAAEHPERLEQAGRDALAAHARGAARRTRPWASRSRRAGRSRTSASTASTSTPAASRRPRGRRAQRLGRPGRAGQSLARLLA